MKAETSHREMRANVFVDTATPFAVPFVVVVVVAGAAAAAPRRSVVNVGGFPPP